MSVRESFLVGDNSAVLTKISSSWSTAHDAASGTVTILSGSGWSSSALGKYSGQYYIRRLALTIDTSNLPADAVISAAKLRFILDISNLSGGDPNEFIYYLVQGNHQEPPIDTDYGAMKDQTSKGIAVSQFDATEELQFSLDAATLAWIQKGVSTLLGCRSDFDIGNDAPDYYSGIVFQNYNDKAEVRTAVPTNIAATTATLNGQALGVLHALVLEAVYTSASEDPTTCLPRYRFQYQKLGEHSYTDCPWQYNKASGALISQNLVGLTPSTIYRFRCQAENERGVYTTMTRTFITLESGPIVTTYGGDIHIDQLKEGHYDRLPV